MSNAPNPNSEILLAIGKLTGEMQSLNLRVGESNRAMIASFTELKTDFHREISGHTSRLDKHSERLKKVENTQSRFLGALALLAAIGAGIWAWLKKSF